MKSVKRLITTVHGSHLYGTSTPESDRDYKGVHLPSGRGIILQTPENVIDESIIAKDADKKNTGEAIDHQSYSLAKFCGMLADGDGFATEILFAPDFAIIDVSDEWLAMRDDARALINKDCKGFVGYCKTQASKYGIKGNRMAAVKTLSQMLNAAIDEHGSNARLEVIEPQLREFAEVTEMASFAVMETSHGTLIGEIECCDRKMGMRVKLSEAANVYGRVVQNYGNRARAAMTNEGVDWKAVSHAVRVARQAQELMSTGHITFPRPDADELLAIKQGRFSYKDVAPLLERLVNELDLIDSVLSKETPQSAIDAIVLPHYLTQIG